MKRREVVKSVLWSLSGATLAIALGESPAYAKQASPVELAMSEVREYLKPGLSSVDIETYFRNRDYSLIYLAAGADEHVMVKQYRQEAPGLKFIGVYVARSRPIRFVQLLGSTTSEVIVTAYMGQSRKLLRADVRFFVLTIEFLKWR